ncbi:MAG: hypothetical protein P8Y48_07900, partial [Novosphingobium sp.]
MFKGRHFHGELILLCVRWYPAYGLSLRDLEEMIAERIASTARWPLLPVAIFEPPAGAFQQSPKRKKPPRDWLQRLHRHEHALGHEPLRQSAGSSGSTWHGT